MNTDRQACLHNDSNATFADGSKNNHNKDNNQEDEKNNEVDNKCQMSMK